MSAMKVSGLGLETVEVYHDYKKGKDMIGIRERVPLGLVRQT